MASKSSSISINQAFTHATHSRYIYQYKTAIPAFCMEKRGIDDLPICFLKFPPMSI